MFDSVRAWYPFCSVDMIGDHTFNMINKIIREVRREGKEGGYSKGMGGGEEMINRFNEWTLKARYRWWQLMIIIPSINVNVFANVYNLYYVSLFVVSTTEWGSKDLHQKVNERSKSDFHRKAQE